MCVDERYLYPSHNTFRVEKDVVAQKPVTDGGDVKSLVTIFPEEVGITRFIIISHEF